MILVDTSVWISHLRQGEKALIALLADGAVLTHPLVIGEVAMGRLRARAEVLALLRRLPRAAVATDDEVLALIDDQRLWGSSIGYVDAHLIAGCRLTQAPLWTADRRLADVAAAHADLFVPPG